MSVYGLLTAKVPNDYTVKFFELFESDWFKSSGSLRNVWLTMAARLYQAGQVKATSMVGYLNVLSDDNSLFVRRLSYKIWAKIINTETVDLVAKELCSKPNLAQEVIIQLKLTKKFDQMAKTLDGICKFHGEIFCSNYSQNKKS